ncbi:Hypothetical protein CINCED_3A015973 [Cinara cedri]|uniref:Uncharacterized protein n=1 Tax=Cinara cedri TaxID=506608 RepID=A0A5E4NCN9_9HEMI|nr:Hypothetical protein CINCED_3A015973 [Cinara cedri]
MFSCRCDLNQKRRFAFYRRGLDKAQMPRLYSYVYHVLHTPGGVCTDPHRNVTELVLGGFYKTQLTPVGPHVPDTADPYKTYRVRIFWIYTETSNENGKSALKRNEIKRSVVRIWPAGRLLPIPHEYNAFGILVDEKPRRARRRAYAVRLDRRRAVVAALKCAKSDSSDYIHRAVKPATHRIPSAKKYCITSESSSRFSRQHHVRFDLSKTVCESAT